MNKKRLYILFMSACLMMTHAYAQQISFGPLHSLDSPREDWILPGDTILQDGKKMIYSGKPMQNSYVPLRHINESASNGLAPTATYYSAQDSLQTNHCFSNLTPNNYGYGWGDYGWGLHKGLNMSVDLSAFATFDKHAPHRGGFTQTIDATYLTPLSKDERLWMALGVYLTNTNYGGDSYHDGGLYGILGYKINKNWEAYVYGQLSVANNYNTIYGRYAGYGPYGYGAYGYRPYGFGMHPGYWSHGIMPGGYGMGVPGANVLGGGIRYTNDKKTFSIGLNVEGIWYDNKTPSYFKKYDYPTPNNTAK